MQKMYQMMSLRDSTKLKQKVWKFKTTDFKGAIDKYTEALNTQEMNQVQQKIHRARKSRQSSCKLSVLSNRAACYNNIRE